MEKIQKIKNFVKKHNEALVVAVLATLAITAQYKTQKQMNEFLVQKDLYNEFYSNQE